MQHNRTSKGPTGGNVDGMCNYESNESLEELGGMCWYWSCKAMASRLCIWSCKTIFYTLSCNIYKVEIEMRDERMTKLMEIALRLGIGQAWSEHVSVSTVCFEPQHFKDSTQ